MIDLTDTINFLTNFYFPYRNKLLGKLLKIDTDTILFGKNIKLFKYKNIKLGKHVLVNSNFQIIGNGKVTIENFTYTAPNITILTSSHDKENMNESIDNVKIEKMCWIGANVTILPGIIIKEGSIIGAGSVVSKSIPPYSIAYGSPIKIIQKKRKISYPYRLPGGNFYLIDEDTIVDAINV